MFGIRFRRSECFWWCQTDRAWLSLISRISQGTNPGICPHGHLYTLQTQTHPSLQTAKLRVSLFLQLKFPLDLSTIDKVPRRRSVLPIQSSVEHFFGSFGLFAGSWNSGLQNCTLKVVGSCFGWCADTLRTIWKPSTQAERALTELASNKRDWVWTCKTHTETHVQVWLYITGCRYHKLSL